ncbi:Rep family protein [Lactiplantibacillus plantarum]|uniref:Rep family protein n=1 Tax=Lactiplantibacillus plantarum TaxID=1590 RepID=UPI0039A30FF7
MTCEITWLKLSKSKRKDRNKHKKRAHPSKARSLIACSDTVILTLWLKIRQGTSLFVISGSIPADWKQRLELIGVPIAISPLHDKDKSSAKGQIYKKPIIT